MYWTPPENEAALVALARQGDKAAFDDLTQHYWPLVHRFIAQMIGADEVGADLAQETFVHAWWGLLEIDRELSFRVWLFRIAKNQAYSYLRSPQRKRFVPLNNAEHVSIPAPEEDVLVREEIREVLAHLSPQSRACLIRFIEGYPQGEIAEELQIAESTVSSYIQRARKQLRQLFRPLACEITSSRQRKKEGRRYEE